MSIFNSLDVINSSSNGNISVLLVAQAEIMRLDVDLMMELEDLVEAENINDNNKRLVINNSY
jgi:hypothetical protein